MFSSSKTMYIGTVCFKRYLCNRPFLGLHATPLLALSLVAGHNIVPYKTLHSVAFVTGHMTFVTGHMTFVTGHMTFVTGHMTFHMTSVLYSWGGKMAQFYTLQHWNDELQFLAFSYLSCSRIFYMTN